LNALLEIIRQHQAGHTSGREISLEEFGLEGAISAAMFARIWREVDGTSRGLPNPAQETAE
jgi:hypothetical protein